MNFIIHADRNNAKEVTEKVRFQWMKNVLQNMGIEWGDSLESDDPGNLSILQRAQIRRILEQNKNLEIADDHDGGIVIYVEKEPIARWEKPYYRLHHDQTEINHQKRWYISIQVSCWSVFDQELEESSNG